MKLATKNSLHIGHHQSCHVRLLNPSGALRGVPGTRLRALSGVALAACFFANEAKAIDVASQADWNAAVTAVSSAGPNTTTTINITSGFTLSSSLSALTASNANVTVNIVGNNSTINGNALYQGIKVLGTNAPTVTISNLTLTNTLAKGGNGGGGGDGGGGGGLGAGGGLFVASGANVTLQDVSFINNKAQGGNGGVSGANSGGAGGGGLNGGNGGTPPGGSGTGGAGGVGAGGAGFAGSGGTAGTGGGVNTNNGGAGGAGTTGGGGGGGGAVTGTHNGGAGGAGGFGGGGGGGGGFTSTGINGAGGAAGYGGGAGGNGYNGAGTGGTGYGGAVFVMAGATLTIKSSGDLSYSGNTTAKGSGGSPSANLGQDIFINGASQVITFQVDAGTSAFIGSAQTTQGSIAGEGGLNKTGAGTLALSGTQRYTGATTISGGALMLNGSLASSVTVNSGAAMSVAAGSTGTINGNYTQATDGIFRTHVINDGTYGKLVVSGTANLPTNAKINVDVSDPRASFTATSLTNVLTAGALNSDGTFSVTDNSLLFNFGAVKNGNAIDLTIKAAAPAILPSIINQGNTQAAGAAGVLDQIITSDPTGSLANRFVGLTSESQVSNAVSQTLPLLSGGATVVARNTLSGLNRIIESRIDSNRGLSSGDDFYGDKHIWLKPFGSWANQSDRNGVAGFKANTYGMVAGVDGTLSPALRLGGAFAYARSNVDGNSAIAPQNTTVDVYQLIGYGSVSLDDRTDVNFQGDIGQNNNNGTRQITFSPSVASSSYHSQTAHIGAGIGRTYTLDSKTALTPSVRADYTWIKDKAYSETGAGPLNLNVDSRSTEAFIIGVDGKLAHHLNDRTTLIANLGVGYDTINKQNTITSAFAEKPTAAFVTYGINPSPWLAHSGFAAVYQIKSGVELTGRYDAEYRQSFLNQTASVKARWVF